MGGSWQPEALFCTAGDCLEPAVAHGRVTLEVGPSAGAAPDEARQTFSLPLCEHHARLLGFGNTLVGFTNGLVKAGDGEVPASVAEGRGTDASRPHRGWWSRLRRHRGARGRSARGTGMVADGVGTASHGRS